MYLMDGRCIDSGIKRAMFVESTTTCFIKASFYAVVADD
jgi:hypothetical protein